MSRIYLAIDLIEMDSKAYIAANIQGRKLYFAFILAFLDLEMA